MSNLKTKGKRHSIGASVMILETWKYEKTDIFLICCSFVTLYQINLYSFICHTWLNIQKAIKVFRAADLLQGSYKYAHYHLYYLETIYILNFLWVDEVGLNFNGC